MIDETAPVVVKETIVLNKYEGDPTSEEMEALQPLETVLIEDGVIVEHIVWKEVDNNGSN